MEPAPTDFGMLRKMLTEHFSIIAVKQSQSNPRNVVFALKARRPGGRRKTLGGDGLHASQSNMALHLVG